MKTKQLLLVICFGCLIFTSLSMTETSLKTENDLEYTLKWEGRERSYFVHLPPAGKMKEKLPILFNLHGGGGSAKKTNRLTFNGFNRLADKEGFIVVYPQGLKKQWNDGREGDISYAHKENIDDVGFIVQIVNELKSKYNIDTEKIFTSGMSNGGFMSTRLLCERPDVFRGGAVLTSQIGVNYEAKCQPSKGVAIMIMNGTDDPIVPYNGGEIKIFKRSKPRGVILSTDDFVAMWQDRNDCKVKGETKRLPDLKDDGTTIEVTTYSNCKTDGALVFYKIIGGGHTWPGGKQYLGERIIGKTSKDIIACKVIWDYFKNLD